ncbi:MAG TPA: EthD domain-containing protein, partial [Caulobacter sp.]|nr:EthD domain-containing protein [Caulobacter sp.]
MTARPLARLTVAVTRLPTLDRPAFQAYWRERHGPLVRRLAGTLGIVGYVQLHADLEDEGPDDPARRPWSAPCDGLAQIWYASRQDFEARMTDP